MILYSKWNDKKNDNSLGYGNNLKLYFKTEEKFLENPTAGDISFV